MPLKPRDPDFESRVRDSFAQQKMMALLGAELISVRLGEVQIGLQYRENLTQQHGFVHAAAITAIADNACGYAALSLMAPGMDVLSVEFKVNLLSPAAGQRFIATGKVLRSGKTLTVCAAKVHAIQDDTRKLVSVMQATMIATSSLEKSDG